MLSANPFLCYNFEANHQSITFMKKFTLLFLVLLVVISSCKKDDDKVDPKPSESEIIENNIQAALDSIIENTHVPGLVAGVWAPNEGIDFVYSAGVSNIETNTPMDADMIFRIGSNTKTFTITVLLQLVDEGLISLDDPLSDYFPDFPKADSVKIEMLTNMRSGIFSYDETDGFWEGLFSNPTKFWTPDELILLAKEKPYYFTPGTDFHYSNIVDMRKYVEALAGGEFLQPATQQERLVCHEIYSGYGYGEGISGYKGFYGHNGEYPGFTSLMINSPERKCTIIIWYNCELDSANPLVLSKLIPELIYHDF